MFEDDDDAERQLQIKIRNRTNTTPSTHPRIEMKYLQKAKNIIPHFFFFYFALQLCITFERL